MDQSDDYFLDCIRCLTSQKIVFKKAQYKKPKDMTFKILENEKNRQTFIFVMLALEFCIFFFFYY